MEPSQFFRLGATMLKHEARNNMYPKDKIEVYFKLGTT